MAVVVKEFMIEEPLTIKKDATIGDAVELFGRQRIGSLPVIDDSGKIVGFVTDGDVIHYVVRNVSRLMSDNIPLVRTWDQLDCFSQYIDACVDHPIMNCATKRVIQVSPEDTVKKASRLMNKKHLKHVPVVQDGKVVGVVTRNDIVRGIFNDYLDFPDAPCVEGEQEDDF